ncbi:afg3 atpase family [Cystoisospora suis]|uniref:Afg3 atpase family n=1 Tax=Cystoisospora suis TaxID=483139 RepID=A0A2C6L1M6_9APIC|nr:afg3 atpase family [Cystoisospora suis]
MVSDVLFMRRIRRGGGAGGSGGSGSGGAGGSGLNRFLSQTSSKRARVKPESVKVRFADVAAHAQQKERASSLREKIDGKWAFLNWMNEDGPSHDQSMLC